MEVGVGMFSLPYMRLDAVLRIVFAVAVFAGVAVASERGTDRIVLKSGRSFSRVAVLKDGHDKVEIDRDGDGKANETFTAEAVESISYGDAPKAFRQATLDYRVGRFSAAIEQFEAALQAEETREFWLKPYSYFYIGECFRQLAETDKELLPKARAAYERVLLEAPDSRLAPDAIRGLGLCFLEQGDTDEARSEFEKLVADDRYGAIWGLRGKLLVARVDGALGKYKEGMALCEKVAAAAAAADRKDLAAEAVCAQAELLLAAKEYDKAQQAFRGIALAARESDVKTKAFAYNGIGDALLGEGRTREALLAYLRVRVLYFRARKQLPRGLYGAARCFRILRKSNEARELVTLLEKEYPNSIWTAKAKEDLRG